MGHRIGVVDHPGGRKVHAAPIPRLGGVALALALTVALGVAVLLEAQQLVGASPDPKGLLPIITGAALVFAVGLWDDIDPVPARVKLIVELVAALVVAGSGIAITRVTVIGHTYELGWVAIPLTVGWVLVVANAYNLMDGLDGLAAGLAAIGAATCAIVLLARGEREGAMLLIALVGAIAGFVAYNFHPARIFLGDSGSLLVGFLLGVTAITGQQKGATTLAIGVPLLIFALPIAETSLTVLRRVVAGQRNGGPGVVAHLRGLSQIFQADRAHLHHRLLDGGLSHRRTVVLLYVVAMVLSGIALATMQVN
jgi:UDP-GlcNAc:undecaprenyl-phosphate GlcNAc-1-phosphate transferase